MTLLDLWEGEIGIITKVRGRGAFRKRITEMGFVRGNTINVVKYAPLSDPIEYQILDYSISLRRAEAQLIEVVGEKELKDIAVADFNGVITEDILRETAKKKEKIIDVALVGNPNSGKTTLFNFASGSYEHVGNYGGVTVELKKAEFIHRGYLIRLVDLPGTYSLTSYTQEELYVRKHIVDSMPDVVINVIDSSNLERNLYLTTQLIDLDINVIGALNMYDEFLRKGDMFDYLSLGKMLGVPLVPVVSSKQKGLSELFDKVVDVFEESDPTVRHIHINYGKEVEESIRHIQEMMWKFQEYPMRVSTRFLALKLLEKDPEVLKFIEYWPNCNDIVSFVNERVIKLEGEYKEQSETILANAKYGFIKGALRETYRRIRPIFEKKTQSNKIDAILTHKYFGFPIFVLFLIIMFQTTFHLGAYPMQWMEQGVSVLGSFLQSIIPDGIISDILINGVLGGVGGVIVFLPNILFLFLFISFMEDTGYMARVAFIMDRLMHLIGLHGKSFIPLIMGFGCNVPAIMATRSLENRKDRLITMLINPFMSCSARLPVYILITAAVFPNHPVLIIMSLYAFGILLSILFALLFKFTIFRKKEAPFVMELPPYRLPTLRSVIRHMWFKGSQYLKKMGGIILLASLIIWALGYFPRTTTLTKEYDVLIKNTEISYQQALLTSDSSTTKVLQAKRDSAIGSIEFMRESERQENSYLGQIGKAIEPVIRPLGFDWKMGISLLSGIAAKEVVISTLGVLYQADEIHSSNSLTDRIRNQKDELGNSVYSPIVALAFLVFILIYFPCVAVVAVIRKESGSWKWALFLVFYTTLTAWIMAFLVYQGGSLLMSML